MLKASLNVTVDVRLRCRHEALHTTTDTDGDENVDQQSRSRPEPAARPAGNESTSGPAYNTAAAFDLILAAETHRACQHLKASMRQGLAGGPSQSKWVGIGSLPDR